MKAFRDYGRATTPDVLLGDDRIVIAAEVNSDSPRSSSTSGTSRSLPRLTTQTGATADRPNGRTYTAIGEAPNPLELAPLLA